MRLSAVSATGLSLAAYMSKNLRRILAQASQFGRPLGKPGLVADIIVQHQIAAPAMKECTRMGAGAAGLIVEYDDGRAAPSCTPEPYAPR